MLPEIVPVILAGGEGRRLRPLTAPTRPKPFLRTFSNYSLLQMALMRASAFAPPVVICDERFAKYTDDEASEIGITEISIIAEPVQRSTAGAIASAAFLLQQKNPLMLVMPSDHLLGSAKIFEETIRRAAALAPENAPVILGKKPASADNRYGYILSNPLNEAFALDSFIEKPSPPLAKKLSRTDGVFWNTGIFLCYARTLLELIFLHAPDVFESAGNAMAGAAFRENILRPGAGYYAAIPSLSIDHAVMEKLSQAVILPLETDWHDVGCWESLIALKFKNLSDYLYRALPYDSKRKRSA